MVKPFLCGVFPPEADDESPGPSSPRKCTPGSRSLAKDNKNPYSARGLDKFSSLLAELEEKRQKIYSQMDSQDIIVRFVYKNADDCVPVVVKPKYGKDDKNKVEATKMKNRIISSEAMGEPAVYKPAETETNGPISMVSKTGRRSEKKNSSLIMKMKRWSRPSNYLPVIIILILLLMALFGRSMAILCTSIGWYVVPSMKETSTSKRPTKKKDLARRYSDTRQIVNGFPSPRRNNTAGAEKEEKSHHWIFRQTSF